MQLLTECVCQSKSAGNSRKTVKGEGENLIIRTLLQCKNLGKLNCCKRIFFISLVFNG